MTVELNEEQFEQLPDFLKTEYKEVDGVYKNAAVMTLKQTNNDLNSRFNELDIKFKGFEEQKAADIEAAKAKALEEAKSSKDIEAIERQYQEQMQDLERRTTERVKNETLSEFKKEQASKDAANLAKEISIKLAADDAQDDLNALIGMRVKADESGNIVFLNADGSASTMSKDEFIEDVKSKHKYLVKATVTTTGAGAANGNLGGSAEKMTTTDKARAGLRGRLKKHGL